MAVNLKKDEAGAGYSYTETIADGATGQDIITPFIEMHNAITCTLHAGVNTGKFQFTTSPTDAILQDTAIWIDWPSGDVSGTNYDAIVSPITGLRGVSTSGEITIEVVR